MNIFRALRQRGKGLDETPELREKLPQINAFVDIGMDGGRDRKSVSVSDITAKGLVTGCPDGLAAGATADFLYINDLGRFRFATVCRSIEGGHAVFDLPTSIKTIESFAYRRTAPRVPWVIPVEWRYAPDGNGYGEFLPASMKDLSRGGASLVVGRELKEGTRIEVRFVLKSKAKPLVEICQVVRAAKIERSDRNAAGIAFIGVDSEDARALSEFINERQSIRRDRGVV
jgi:hypothetical protein